MTNCKHAATVVYSRTLVIDRCMSCQGFLIWCENIGHEDANGLDKPRHWHFAKTANDAAKIAGAPADSTGRNVYGIVRPEPRAAKGIWLNP